MKAQVGFRVAVMAFILALAVVPGQAWGLPETAGTTSSGGLVWRTAYVDQSGSRGTHTSIAFDPGDGTPWISYYDVDNTALMVAHRVSSGGNCGPDNEWYCETVDNNGDVGQYSSIDVAPDTVTFPNLYDGKIGVAYHDATNDALKFAEYSCYPCEWRIHSAASGRNPIEYRLTAPP